MDAMKTIPGAYCAIKMYSDFAIAGVGLRQIYNERLLWCVRKMPDHIFPGCGRGLIAESDIFECIHPVFGTGAGLGAVKRQKAVRVAVFPLRCYKSYGVIFWVQGHLVTGFVRSASCICADSFSKRYLRGLKLDLCRFELWENQVRPCASSVLTKK
jgi:hypothetical protein